MIDHYPDGHNVGEGWFRDQDNPRFPQSQQEFRDIVRQRDELAKALRAIVALDASKTAQINALVEALRELEPAALRLSQLTNMANKEPGAPASEWHATRQAIDRARAKARAAIAKATAP